MATKKPKDLITLTVEAPAAVLQKTVEVTEGVANALPENQVLKKTRDYWHMLGPGLTTGASDDDPSGITTYSQTGAQYGYNFLWLSAWTFPLMATVQEMCARIGLITGRGLAHNIRVFYSRRILTASTFLLFLANTFNIGANLGAMAAAAQLIAPNVNYWLFVIGFALLSMLLQVFTPYEKYAKYLKWLALILISYIASAILAKLNWSDIAGHFSIPKMGFDQESIILLSAILGTTISPYLFFWQTSQEVEEQILLGKTTVHARSTKTDPSEIKKMRFDVWTGMLLSNVVMFFIIAACGGVLHQNGITNIESAAQAAEALRPFAGDSSYFLFALGIIGTGLLSIPVLAGSSSYALSERFRWKEGLYQSLGQAQAFYGVIIISILIGLSINFIGLDPIRALIYAAVANALVAPVVLFLIIRISSNRRVMGKWVNKPLTTFVGWITFGLMAASAILVISTLFVP